MHLDELQPLEATVGYGRLGVGGSLGYEGKSVSVRGNSYSHTLSTHPPARLAFAVHNGYQSFHTLVALNDDVPSGHSQADFLVYADGRLVATESGVRAGEAPRQLVADIKDAKRLELEVRTSRWEFCHAVWLEPRLDTAAAPRLELEDALRRARLHLPSIRPKAQRCIATASSAGFAGWLDSLLGSLNANGGCGDALRVVFLLGEDPQSEQVASRYGAQIIRCTPLQRLNPSSKGVLYSVAQAVDAEYFLCLDADMLVLGDLEPLFQSLQALPAQSILAVREGNHSGHNHLGQALAMYLANPGDQARLGMSAEEIAYPLVVNAGLFAGRREGLLELDQTLRGMDGGLVWLDENPRVGWRDQFLFNLALARLKAGVELEGSYNVQLQTQTVTFQSHGAQLEAIWQGQAARVVHFSGGSKHQHKNWQRHYAGLAQPLLGGGDAYGDFLKALRQWVGRYGLGELAWSFYGTTDGKGARVADPSSLPLLGLLHYLVRANGCVRVLETGTARGVSAACLASAVAHRSGARVVTLDPYTHPGREELWALLPDRVRNCIEARQVDGLAGMQAAIEAGERYEAALLDSIHSAEHVWAEFEQVRQLVVPSGLILIHDINYTGGTVAAAVQRIEQSGYPVTRLWSAEGGIPEDDHLGLALIENRLREV